MTTNVKSLLQAANAEVPRLAADEVRAKLREGAVLLDVRDPNEVAVTGKLHGAVAVSRGLLEFRADPDSPAHAPELRPDRPVLIYCASGGRAALSGKTLREMGYATVFNAGGFKDLADAGFATDPV